MKKNLIIGSSSQIAQYLGLDFVKVNSRSFNWEDIDQSWGTSILAFGENRKFLDSYDPYRITNIELTLKTIDFLKTRSEKVIIFSTCELWNKCSGPIDLETPFNFYETFYTNSKFILTQEILTNPELYPNVFIVYPFNFNSIYRTEDFLFGKIFNSIILQKPIVIGDTYYYRDIFHPTFMVKELENITEHKIVGSGRLTHINDFIRELYLEFSLDYGSLVTENLESFKEYDIKYEYYLKSRRPYYEYNSLLEDTIRDLKYKKNVQ
jgi:nucleoside-diphosphate-sugar epimerase